MKQVNALTIIQNDMLPVLRQELKLTFVDDHYELENFDVLSDKIQNWLNNVDNFIYSPEDRSFVKQLKADNNKLIQAVTAVINEQTSTLMNVVQTQKKELTSQLSVLTEKLGRGVDEEDKAFKSTKRKEYMELFETLKSDIPSLENSSLVFDDVFISSWLNRSTTLKKVTNEMNDRLNAIDYLIQSDACPTSDVDDIVEALDFNDWSGLTTLDYLIKKEKDRQEKEMQRLINERLEKQRQLEKEKALAEAKGEELKSTTVEKLPDVLIKIAGEDSKKAQDLLKAAGVNFVVI